MRNFSSEDRWDKKRKTLAQQEEEAAVLYEERVATQTSLYGDGCAQSITGISTDNPYLKRTDEEGVSDLL